MHYSSSALEHICAMWQSYLFSDICQVYSAHCHMVDSSSSDFICGIHTYMYIHLPCESIRYLAYMAYVSNLVGIFASSTLLAVT